MSRRFALVLALTLGTSVLAAGDAAAQTPTRAEELFVEGRAAADRGDWAVACAKFEESLTFDNTVGATLNLGECNEKLGRLTASLAAWKRGLARMPADDARRDLAERKIGDLEKRAPKLIVQAGAGDSVFVDGQPAAANSPVMVDPGLHKVVVAGASGSRSVDVTVVEGEVKPVSVEPASQPGAAPGAGPTAPPPTEEGEGSSMTVPAIVAFGVGGAGLVVFGVTGLLYLGEKSTVDEQCTPGCTQEGLDAGDQGFTYGIVNAIGLGVAVVGAGIGTTLLLVGGSDDQPEVRATLRGPGLSVDGRF